MRQEQKRAQREDDEVVDDEIEVKPADVNSDIDEILDAIDEVLESNAELFVREYVQKGGEL